MARIHVLSGDIFDTDTGEFLDPESAEVIDQDD